MSGQTHRFSGLRLASGLLLALGGALLLGPSVTGLIRHSITVDGNVSDWADILTDPENVVADAGAFSDPPDPDAPGTADRDLRGAAFTWDNTNLYLFFRRTLSGNSAFEYLAYIDLDHDRLLETTDRVVRLSYNGANFQSGIVYAYVPATAGGDALTGDGVDEPGTLGAIQPGTPTSANSPDGIEFEAAVPWSALGVPAGTCLFIHPSIARGINLPGQVEDNADPLDTQDVAPRLEQDRAGSSASPGTVDYAHLACNDGSCADVLDLSVRSNAGWRIELFTDPNGDGDPSDGTRLAVNGNGDGDFSDDRDGDLLDPGADTNGNGYPDTGSLDGDVCFAYVVRVFVPAGVADGTTDIESVRARSATRARDLVRNTDTTTVGLVVVFTDEDRSATPGDVAWLPHTACNHQAVPDTLDLTVTDTQGFALETHSDPNGDGDPSDGSPITSTGVLAPGECFTFLVRVSVPIGTTAGTIDNVTVTATSRTTASRNDSAADTVTVFAARFTVTPNHDRDAGPGNSLFLPHLITNHGSVNDSFTLAATSPNPAYTLTLLTDPNGDGEPDDSTTIAPGSPVGPVDGNGGTYHFILRVNVPTNAAFGSTNTITVTATSLDDGATATASDIIRIRRILTYSDPVFARPSKTFFTSCAKVYVQAHGLATNRNYRFLWRDPANVLQRTSPSYQPDARGRADDSFSLPCGIVPGNWTVTLQERAGANWIDVPGGVANFSTLDPGTSGGDIILLATDGTLYDVNGDNVTVESTLDNDTEADYVDTFADYVIFRDSNGDGVPTAGEFYILADGTRQTWDPGERTHRTDDITVFSGDAFEDLWQVTNAQFGDEGEWCVHERWVTRCTSGSCSEVVIDTALTCFQVSCLPAPLVNAGANKLACQGDVVSLSDATSDGDTFAWSDGGAGGAFSNSAILNPTYTPPGVGTFTLTLIATFSATGCDSLDTAIVTVTANPTVTAGPDGSACADGSYDLSGADGGAADTFNWSDGGAGGTFTPSAAVENPTYGHATPGTYTLTFLATVSSTGCDASDTVAVTINPLPVVTAGADATTCAGDASGLAGSDGGTADTFSWTDGGAGGAFDDATLLHPTYTPPDPSPASITLTLTGTISATGCDSVDSLVLTVNPNPVITAGIDKQECAGDPITLADSDGGTADTFTWTDNSAGGAFDDATLLHPTYTPPDPSPAAITLTLTATVSATGCDSVDSFVLTVNPNPVITAGIDKQECAGDPIALADSDGGTADTFTWTDGGAGGAFDDASLLHPTYTPPDPSPASVTLTLTATVSATGCDSVDSLVLTVNPNPVITAGIDKQECAGDPITLADSDGGTADSFAWTDNGAGGAFDDATLLHPTYTPPDPSPASVTLTLTATIAATGCDSVDSLVLTVNPNPVITAGIDKQECAGDPITLADSVGGTADTFAWTDNGAGGAFDDATLLHPTYTPPDPSAASITLTLTATVSATGCDSVDSLVLTVNANPVITAGIDKQECAGDPITLADSDGGTANTFTWTDNGAGGAFDDATLLHPTYTPPDPSAASITLTLTATVSGTSCDSVDSLVLTVNPNPVITAGANKQACPGDSVALADADGGAADTFTWSDGGAGGTFSPSTTVLRPDYSNATPGAHVLTLTATVAATGCDSTDTVQVTVNPRPAVNAGADKEGCASADIALSDATSDADTFAWSDGGGGGTFTPSSSVLNPSYRNAATGAYTLTLVATHSATGCTRSDTLTVTIRPLPLASFSPEAGPHCEDDPICFTNTSTDATSYLWNFGDPDGNTSTDVSPCFAYSQAGAYTVRLTATNACGSSETTRNITVSPKPVADFSFDTQGNRFCKDKNVTFTDLSTNSPTSWQWDFDDGTTSTLQNPVHSFATDGIFIVQLIACNACGCSAPKYRAVEIASNCNTNCEANSNQIECSGPPTTQTGNTCTDHDNFNTTSYPCAPDYVYSGENKTYDLNFLAGSNFVIRIVETDAEPNGYELDIMVSDRCNPPSCVAWGDTEVQYDDRTAANDDFWLIVDGRDGTCGPYRLEIDCIDPTESAACTPPTFAGVVRATDEDSCAISGIVVEWDAATDWGTGPDGVACPDGRYEIWRAPSDDLSAERNVGSAYPPSTSFLDDDVVPGTAYTYRVHAINGCCGEVALTTATAEATDEFSGDPVTANAGPDRTLTCDQPTATLLGTASGGSGSGFDFLWAPAAGLSDPTVPNPTVSLAGTYTVTVSDRANACIDTDTVTVFGNNVPPTAGAGPDRDLTCTVTNVTLDGSASGGDGSLGYTFDWSPAGPLSDASAENPTTSTPGAYTVTVEDIATGCTNTDTVQVVSNTAAPVASAGADKELTCRDTSVRLDGAGSGGDGRSGYSYSWTPTAGLDDPGIAQPLASQTGTYTLTVTDVFNGCTDDDTVVVTLNDAAPLAGAGPDRVVDCQGTPVTLDGTASGGDGRSGYTFRWEPAENVSDPDAEDPTTSIAATYTLTVTDVHNGCTDTDTVEVTLDPFTPVASAGTDKDLTCLVTRVTLEGSATGGDDSLGYTFRWEPFGDVSDPDIAQPETGTPGTYTLTVTANADGCTSQDIAVVVDLTGLPVAEAGPARVLDCDTSSVTLAGSASGSDGRDGYTFRWEPALDVSDPDIAQPTTSTTGTYTLTVTDNYTGCTSSDSVVVSQDIAAPIAEAGPVATLDCDTASVTLAGSASGGNGSQGYTFRWEPAAQVSDPDIAAPTTSVAGTYTLTVTDIANGCTDDDTVVIAQDVAAPTAAAGPDRALTCTFSSVSLDGSASGGNGTQGYDFRWEPAAQVSDPDIAQPTTSTAGTYTLTVTDRANGCAGSDTVVVTEDRVAPVANAGADKRVNCVTPTVTLEGSASGGNGSSGYQFRWTPAAQVSNPDIAQPTTTTPGTYTLTVTDNANGCTDTDTVVVGADVVASAGPDRVVPCTGPGTVQLLGAGSGGDGSLGYAFRWEPAAQVSNPDIAQPTTSTAGTYTVTVTDVATGCTDTDDAVVTATVAPIANAGPDKVLDCDTTTVTLEGSASGGDGSQGYSFHWEPSSRPSDPDIAQPTTTTPATYTLTVTDIATGCTGTDTVLVTRDVARPVANAGPDVVLDCDDPTVTLLGSATGGNGTLGYAYAWEPAADVSDATIAQPEALRAGTFTLTVTDLANGCTDTNTVRVTQDVGAPTVGAGPDATLDCDTLSVPLNGSVSGGPGPFAFAWTPVTGVADPTAEDTTTTAPGTYTLTVTDLGNSCFASDTVTIAQDIRTPLANAGPDAVLDCTSPGVGLTGSASGGNGTAGYDFHWEPAGAVSSPDTASTQALASGTFTLTVTDRANGCTDTDTVVVASSAPPPIVSAGPDGVVRCNAPVAALLGSVSGGDDSAGRTIQWTPAASVGDPSALVTSTTTPGTYTLLVIDNATGCRAADTVVIASDLAPPIVIAGPDIQLDCDTPTATLSGSASGGNGSAGYDYLWSPAAGLSNPTVPDPIVAAAGTYTLTVTDRANGCSAFDTVTVTLNVVLPIASAGPDKVITCADTSVLLEGSASGGDGSLGYTFAWTPAAGLDDPSLAQPTSTTPRTYTLTVTSVANGCSDSDTVTVTRDIRVPAVTASPDVQLTCNDPLVDISAVASGGNGTLGYSYAWTPADGVTNPSAASTQAFQAGTYTLTATDIANGCQATDTVTVGAAPAALDADAGPDVQLSCADPIATLVGSVSGGDGSQGYAFAWTPAIDVVSPDESTTTTTRPGTYTLTVTDVATGCQSIDIVEVLPSAGPVASAGLDVLVSCVSPSAVLEGEASGGDGSLGYEFAWDPPADVSDPNNATTTALQPGTFTLTVTDTATGCVSADIVTVTRVPAPLEPEPSALDINPAATPLRVTWADAVTRLMLLLTWEDVSAPEYRVHAGTIANFLPPRGAASYDHVLIACGLPTPMLTIAPPQGATYFLAVSTNCDGVDSPTGRDSFGVARPPGTGTCP